MQEIDQKVYLHPPAFPDKRFPLQPNFATVSTLSRLKHFPKNINVVECINLLKAPDSETEAEKIKHVVATGIELIIVSRLAEGITIFHVSLNALLFKYLHLHFSHPVNNL